MEENLFPTPNLPARVEAERSHLRLPSLPEWIEATTEYLKNKAILCGACMEAEAIRLTIALHEALSNSVVHGNLEVSSDLKEQGENAFAELLAARSADPQYASRSVDILMDYDGERCQWILTDEGKGFDVQQVLSRDPQDEEMLLKVSGRGILMMKAFLDEVRYEAGGRRVVLTMRKTSREEKRRHARQPAQQRLRIAPLREDGSVDWDSAYEAVSRNYSPEGIAFLQERLAITDRIIIGIDAESGPLYLPAEVRHWRTLDGDLVELGCRFPGKALPMPAAIQPPSVKEMDEAISALIEQFVEQQETEANRRQHLRVVYTERIEIRDKTGTRTFIGFARDLSRGGMAFITTQPLPLELASLTLPQAQDKPPLKVQVQIVRCDSIMDGFYDVGAKFLQQERDA
jgi:anti-sigma regulatory factor (Ser/Thr protein kinase)